MEGKPIKTEEEVSNVDLQFMGNTDEKRDLNTTVRMESQAAKVAADPEQKGMDKQDVAVAQSMDASDPPSTNMGDTEKTEE
ncbi:M-like protein [Deinococcus cavernae]|uniref:M-like protein n=1 Tax=Deinococcus cavernae TaxID=2320857 RepID=A0A418V503_9DEIO|nr:M-like protein [Deinococcus cavernae]RJF71178.1 M-like protein [Deinococcus cavernae]